MALDVRGRPQNGDLPFCFLPVVSVCACLYWSQEVQAVSECTTQENTLILL